MERTQAEAVLLVQHACQLSNCPVGGIPLGAVHGPRVVNQHGQVTRQNLVRT